MKKPKKQASSEPISSVKVSSTHVSAARKAAFQVLLSVEQGRAHSDDLLRSKTVDALSAPDRHLATALVLGTLRWQIQLDHATRAFLTRPNAKLDAEILIALRMGAFQILHMDRIPARAAIDESVGLAKQAGHRYASGMVNAVLRKLAASTALYQGTTSVVPKTPANLAWTLAPEVLSSGSPAADLALAFAHPAWLVERWVSFYGVEATRAICAHGQQQPSTTIRLVDSNAEAELRQAGVKLEPGSLLTAARTVVSGDVTATAAFLEGRIRLQDEGSQLVAELAAISIQQKPQKIVDSCAAPGGKTLILAERNPQASIVACEQSEPRLEALRHRLAHLAGRIECRLADASALSADANFDLALVDVPCSGTGTLGRNPEIRHRLRPEDLSRQAERQRAILASVLKAVRPGGSVVYSTCSLEPEENEQVVAAVLADTKNAHAVSLAARITALGEQGILVPDAAEKLRNCLTAEGALRLLPGIFPTDGFFIALIERDN
jgi:16S rRNA (cytosine967-C5)-methyltransferase